MASSSAQDDGKEELKSLINNSESSSSSETSSSSAEIYYNPVSPIPVMNLSSTSVSNPPLTTSLPYLYPLMDSADVGGDSSPQESAPVYSVSNVSQHGDNKQQLEQKEQQRQEVVLPPTTMTPLSLETTTISVPLIPLSRKNDEIPISDGDDITYSASDAVEVREDGTRITTLPDLPATMTNETTTTIVPLSSTSPGQPPSTQQAVFVPSSSSETPTTTTPPEIADYSRIRETRDIIASASSSSVATKSAPGDIPDSGRDISETPLSPRDTRGTSTTDEHWSLWESMLICRNIKSSRVIADTLKNMKGYHFNFIVLDGVKVPSPFPFSLFDKFSFDFLEMLNISSLQFSDNFSDRGREYYYGRSNRGGAGGTRV